MPKILATNRQARHDYSILDTFEAGIKLTGAEVKSCKKGQIKLQGSYAEVKPNGEAQISGCHISPYKPAYSAQEKYLPTRPRILLLQKREINTLFGKLKEKRLSLIPLSFYDKGGLIKVELALAQGKKKYEKRDAIKKRDIERDAGRHFRR